MGGLGRVFGHYKKGFIDHGKNTALQLLYWTQTTRI
jgi:hypothetical protein